MYIYEIFVYIKYIKIYIYLCITSVMLKTVMQNAINILVIKPVEIHARKYTVTLCFNIVMTRKNLNQKWLTNDANLARLIKYIQVLDNLPKNGDWSNHYYFLCDYRLTFIDFLSSSYFLLLFPLLFFLFLFFSFIIQTRIRPWKYAYFHVLEISLWLM